MFLFARLPGLSLLLVGTVLAGWQPLDSITYRDTSDISSQSNARSVACDAFGNIHVVWRGRVGGACRHGGFSAILRAEPAVFVLPSGAASGPLTKLVSVSPRW